MLLKVSKKGAEQVDEHLKNVRRGKNSKRKGDQFERSTAKAFKEAYDVELVRTPQSGGFVRKKQADDFRGDIVTVDSNIDLAVHIECKNAKTWSLPAWLNQSESDCPKGKAPLVVFHKFATSKVYVALSLEDFFKLVPREKIVFVKGAKK